MGGRDRGGRGGASTSCGSGARGGEEADESRAGMEAISGPVLRAVLSLDQVGRGGMEAISGPVLWAVLSLDQVGRGGMEMISGPVLRAVLSLDQVGRGRRGGGRRGRRGMEGAEGVGEVGDYIGGGGRPPSSGKPAI